GESLDRRTELFLVGLALRLDRDVDDRSREAHRLEDDRLGRVTERVAGGGVLQALYGDDLTGATPLPLLAVVGVHLVDLADPLLLALGAVGHGGAGLELAGVDADVGELAEVG